MAATPLQKRVQQQAFAVVNWQILGVIMLALFTFPLKGKTASLSVLAGGLAYCIPNWLFVWRVFRYAGAHQMNQFMAAFFLGGMLKLFLSAILFLLVVKYLPVSLLSVLVGFAGAIVLFWVASFWQYTR
jgi:ATP synthase protein I